jgi:hypothetical protein
MDPVVHLGGAFEGIVAKTFVLVPAKIHLEAKKLHLTYPPGG